MMKKPCWNIAIITAGIGFFLILELGISWATAGSSMVGTVAVEDLVFKGLDFKVGSTLEEINQIWGKPLSLARVEVPNTHDPAQKDIIYKAIYDSLEIDVYRINSQPARDFVTRLLIKSNKYPMKWEIRMGISSKRLITLLGNPTHIGESHSYRSWSLGVRVS